MCLAKLVFLSLFCMQFSTELAFDLLAQHRDNYPTFNDDIQVSLAGICIETDSETKSSFIL
jgi:hypothetical protein